MMEDAHKYVMCFIMGGIVGIALSISLNDAFSPKITQELLVKAKLGYYDSQTGKFKLINEDLK